MILLLEKIIRGGISSVMGNKCVQSDENKKILYINAKNLYGHSMSQPLPFDEIKFDNSATLEDILNTTDYSDIGQFIEADIKYPENKKKQRISRLLL